MAIFSLNQEQIDIYNKIHGIESLNETMKQDSFHYLYIGTIINNITLKKIAVQHIKYI